MEQSLKELILMRFFMRKLYLFAILNVSCVFLGSGISFAQDQLDPNTIVKNADEVRNPEIDYTVNAVVKSFKPDRPTRRCVYKILIKGRDNAVVKTLEPQSEYGRSLLIKAKDYWAFYPEVEKPIRISLQEKLIGDVSNGDIARTNFTNDYNASLLRNEDVNGKHYYVLQLMAKDNSTTYGKVILWVEQDNFWPLKAEFYAISGRFLKTCFYENYTTLGGAIRPSRLVLEDAVTQGQYSQIDYDTMNVAALPDKYFSKEYMKKFSN